MWTFSDNRRRRIPFDLENSELEKNIYDETLRVSMKLSIRDRENVFTHLIYHRLDKHHQVQFVVGS